MKKTVLIAAAAFATVFAFSPCFAQSSDVERAILRYDLKEIGASGMPAADSTRVPDTEKKPIDVIDLIFRRAGKKEKKIINQILKTGEETGILTREKIQRQLGSFNVAAAENLYNTLRSLRISGKGLKGVETALQSLAMIDEQLKKTGVKSSESGKLSFFAGLTRDRLADVIEEPERKRELREAALQNYQQTISSLENDEAVASLEKVADAKERSATLTGEFGGIVPLARAKGNSKVFITSDYGVRIHPVKKIKRFHAGIDIAGWKCDGWEVYSIGPGRVVKSGWEAGYGYSVVVSHEVEGNSWFTRYAHLKKKKRATSGKLVKTGDVIGYCNNSGVSTGAHLHFEVREKSAFGATNDPKKFLPVIEMIK